MCSSVTANPTRGVHLSLPPVRSKFEVLNLGWQWPTGYRLLEVRPTEALFAPARAFVLREFSAHPRIRWSRRSSPNAPNDRVVHRPREDHMLTTVWDYVAVGYHE